MVLGHVAEEAGIEKTLPPTIIKPVNEFGTIKRKRGKKAKKNRQLIRKSC